MTLTQLKKFHQARPFTPFRMHIADGRQLDVKHPEFITYTPGGRTLLIACDDESFEVIDLLLDTSLKPRSGKTKTNGRRKK